MIYFYLTWQKLFLNSIFSTIHWKLKTVLYPVEFTSEDKKFRNWNNKQKNKTKTKKNSQNKEDRHFLKWYHLRFESAAFTHIFHIQIHIGSAEHRYKAEVVLRLRRGTTESENSSGYKRPKKKAGGKQKKKQFNPVEVYLQ